MHSGYDLPLNYVSFYVCSSSKVEFNYHTLRNVIYYWTYNWVKLELYVSVVFMAILHQWICNLSNKSHFSHHANKNHFSTIFLLYNSNDKLIKKLSI